MYLKRILEVKTEVFSVRKGKNEKKKKGKKKIWLVLYVDQ